MDVFIPKEYVRAWRSEKMAAATQAWKRSKMVSDSSRAKMEKMKTLALAFRFNKDVVLFFGGRTEDIVFSYFSA